MFGLSMTELLVVLAVALLVIGPKQLPQLARTLGKTLRDVRRATDDLRDTFEREVMDEPRPKLRPNPSSVAARSPTLSSGGDDTSARALTANAPPAPPGQATAPRTDAPSGAPSTETGASDSASAAASRDPTAADTAPTGGRNTGGAA